MTRDSKIRLTHPSINSEEYPDPTVSVEGTYPFNNSGLSFLPDRDSQKIPGKKCTQ